MRPWLKPWSADNAAERITRPLRHNGTPYRGINVLLLWGEAMARGYASAVWMTYRQADELGAHIRKGEQGSMVVYADHFTKTDTNDQGEEIEQDIPFMKAYTVFNVEQIEDLPTHYYTTPEPKGEPLQLIDDAERSSSPLAQPFGTAAIKRFTLPVRISFSCHRPKRSTMQRAMPPPKHTSSPTGPPTQPAWRESWASALATMPMPPRN